MPEEGALEGFLPGDQQEAGGSQRGFPRPGGSHRGPGRAGPGGAQGKSAGFPCRRGPLSGSVPQGTTGLMAPSVAYVFCHLSPPACALSRGRDPPSHLRSRPSKARKRCQETKGHVRLSRGVRPLPPAGWAPGATALWLPKAHTACPERRGVHTAQDSPPGTPLLCFVI